ncbi:MAG: LCP family protein [Nocardioidaceae bacterium]|nr:LCP family protein [Nocardioidaceae bacterium]
MSSALPTLDSRRPGRGVSAAAVRVRLRRAVTLMLMTVLVPGSAQVAAGNRRVGRLAMRCALAAGVFTATMLVVGLLAPQILVAVFTNVWFLTGLRVGLVVSAVGWAYLVVDAWRIADPLSLPQLQRLFMTGLNGVLCLGLSGGLLFASHLVAVQQDFISTVFGAQTVTHPEDGRYNVLLLGGDAGPGRSGIRPDSLTVASIDTETGRTVLFGLPRNMEDVPFPEGSVMHERFPDGFDCEGCYLNGVNTWGTDHANLFGGSRQPGIDATVSAVEEITGLAINYYVLIDLRGFRELVDAVGGVDIKVGERIPIGGVGGPVTGWIEPGKQHLDGYRTLWFARSRATSDDYSRMARQKCVMNAMLRQLDPQTVVTNFGGIATAGKQVISTSIPSGELATFVDLALKTRSLPVSSVSFVPPKIDTGDPDWSLIRSMVNDELRSSGAKDGLDLGSERWLPRHRTSGPQDANDSGDLTAAC